MTIILKNSTVCTLLASGKIFILALQLQDTIFLGFFNLKYFISCSWILSNSLIKDRNNGSVLELPVELPSTWAMHWDLTFLNLLSPLPSVNEKKESSFEGDPEIGPFSRESCYTSTQTSFADVISPFNCAIWWSWRLEDEGSLGFDMVSYPGKGKVQELLAGQESMRIVLLSQPGLSGAREWDLQCTSVPLLLLMEQSCRKWELSCLFPMLSFYTHSRVFSGVRFPLSLTLKAVLEATSMN